MANALRYTFELTPTGAGPVSLHVATASCDGKMDGAGDGAELKTLQLEVEGGGTGPGPVIPDGEIVDAGIAPPGGSAVEGYLSCQTARGTALPSVLLTIVLLARRRGQICARRR